MFEAKFYGFCEKLVGIIKKIIGIMLCLMLMVVVFQVFWRGVLNRPTPWTEEISTYLMTYITFIGGIAVMIRGDHLAIDLVSEHVSVKVKNIFQVLYIIVFLFVCGYLCYFGAQLLTNPLIANQKSIAAGIPRIYVYIVMPVSMGLSFIYCLFHLFFTLRHIARGTYVNPKDITHNNTLN